MSNEPRGPRTIRELFEHLREDFEVHHRDASRPGFRALAVHRFGTFTRHLEPKLVRGPLRVGYRAMFRYVRNVYGIELPDMARVGRRVTIEHQGCIVVHGSAVIGDECIIRQGVTLGNRRLDRPHDAPKLGRAVNVGAGAKLLGSVTVGDGATIGANSVVTRDVPAGCVAVGIPAKLLADD